MGFGVLVTGSAHANCDRQGLEKAHEFVRSLVRPVLDAGGHFSIFLPGDPQSSHPEPLPILFDGTVLREVAAYAERGDVRDRCLLHVVTANKHLQSAAAASHLPHLTVARLRNVVAVDILGDEMGGGIIRDRQLAQSHAVIVVSGGKGALDVARKAREVGLPVLPMDIRLGNSLGEKQEGASLHPLMLSQPRDFFRHTHADLAAAAIDISLAMNAPAAVGPRVAKLVATEVAAVRKRTPDALIVTALPVELDAVRRAIGVVDAGQPETLPGSVLVWSHEVSDRRVAVVCLANAGTVNAAGVLSTVLGTYSPRHVLMAGIAAGRPKKSLLGRCVIAEKVVAYEPTALKPDGPHSRPDMTDVHPLVRQHVASYFANRDVVKARVQPLFERVHGGPMPVPPAKLRKKAVAGVDIEWSTVASGEKLVRDAGVWDNLAAIHDKIDSAEMEAAGIAAAAVRYNLPWLVVRGISDFGDKNKNDTYHRAAASIAAVVAVDIVVHALPA